MTFYALRRWNALLAEPKRGEGWSLIASPARTVAKNNAEGARLISSQSLFYGR
jgi:hypothetical protein